METQYTIETLFAIKDVGKYLSSYLPFCNILTLRLVSKSFQNFVDVNHLPNYYYCLGNPVQVGQQKASMIQYAPPSLDVLSGSLPSEGEVILFRTRGDAIASLKNIVNNDKTMTMPIFCVRLDMKRHMSDTKAATVSDLDSLNKTKEKRTMIFNKVQAEYLTPVRAIVFDGNNRVIKNEGKFYIDINPDEATELGNSHCVIL